MNLINDSSPTSNATKTLKRFHLAMPEHYDYICIVIKPYSPTKFKSKAHTQK